MKDEVLCTLRDHNMLSPGDRVVVGVSGGADSMSLLHFLHSQREALGILVVAAHVNHGLRGRESDGDEAFVRHWCAEKGIPCHVARCDVRRKAAEWKLGEEACGRRLRYSFFLAVAGQVAQKGTGAVETAVEWAWEGTSSRQALPPRVKVATAHTLSDSVETVLLHMARGTGGRGLCGIPPVRGGIIRPLIAVTRRQVEEYCGQNGISYVTDSTNSSLEYSRNRIRALVVPQMEQLNPSFARAMLRMMRQQAEDEACLSAMARDALEQSRTCRGYGCRSLAALPGAVLGRALVAAVKQFGADEPEMRHIDALRGCVTAGSGAVTLPGGLVIRVEEGELFAQRDKPQESSCVCPMTIPMPPPEKVVFMGNILHFQVIECKSGENCLKIYKKLLSRCLNYDTIPNSIVLRTRQPGDRFYGAGRGVGKTLKKLFNELHVPQEERDRRLIVEGGGELLWIEGIGVSEKAKISEDTRKLLVILPGEDVK